MKIAILGYGVEGHSAEQYFSAQGADCTVFDHFQPEDVANLELESYDLVLRSPSVRPPQEIPANWSSITQYFFQHCPCPIIGVTGTKGKGTTCSLIASIMGSLGQKAYLVGNIGTPALEVFDQLTPDDVVIYELSSFQLWDLQQSPHVAVVLRIEPDHLNVHRDFTDYITAKSNITKHQTKADYCIYYQDNPSTQQAAQLSPGTQIPFPLATNRAQLDQLLDNLTVLGAHNREDSEAALLASAAFYRQPLNELITKHQTELAKALANFKGLPHRLEFVRELNGVSYYDDSFSSAYPALDVAISALANYPTVLIAGGKDRGLDLTQTKKRIFSAPNLLKAILIGETSQTLAKDEDPTKYQLAPDLSTAVQQARQLAEAVNDDSAVLLSPGAASFDMFKNFKDRGEQFQTIVKQLN